MSDRVKKSVRGRLKSRASHLPKLVVTRTSRHISVQIKLVDGQIITGVSTQTPQIKDKCKNGGNVEAAKLVGKAIAEIAKKKGLVKFCFDRGGCKYTGRVEALANAAREQGLEF